MKILFGTRNQSKRDRMRNLLSPLNLEIISLEEIGITTLVLEDGDTAKENAIKKAQEYYKLSNIPTFSIDYALRVDKFPEETQPNTHVRRIWQDKREATDEELLSWFINELEKVGGTSTGTWYTAIALVTNDKDIFIKTLKSETLFISKPCKVAMKGEPLNSIQFDTRLEKYVAERSAEEWVLSNNLKNQQIIEFFRDNIK